MPVSDPRCFVRLAMRYKELIDKPDHLGSADFLAAREAAEECSDKCAAAARTLATARIVDMAFRSFGFILAWAVGKSELTGN